MEHRAPVLLTLALCAPAAAQSTLTAVDVLSDPLIVTAEPVVVAAHPDGGAVSVFSVSRQNSPRRNFVICRVDSRGDRVWTVDRALPLLFGNHSRVAEAVVTARGSTVVRLSASFALVVDGYSVLMSFDADGQLEWERDLPSGAVGIAAPYSVVNLGATSNGDVFVAGIVDSSLLAPFAGNTSLRLLAGADGSELWRHEAAAIANIGAPMLAEFRDDEAHLVYMSPNGITAEAIGANAGLLYTTTGLQPSLTAPVPSFLAVGAAGEIAFGHWEGWVSQDNEVVVLDASGALAWRTLVPVTWGLAGAAFTTSGELVVIEGNLGRRATRFDTAGIVRWQHSAPQGAHSYQSVLADDTDGVVLAGYDDAVPYPYTSATLEFVDALGVTRGVERYSASGEVEAVATRPARDARGNLWMATGRYPTSTFSAFPTSGSTLRVVPGLDPSAPGCAPGALNSTGQVSRLRTAGSTAAAQGNLTLVADQLPPGSAVMFLNSRTAGFAPNPGGSLGDLCLGAPIGRYARTGEVRTASAAGLAALPLDLASTPSVGAVVSILAGESWHFQAWHRDTIAGQARSNFTGSVRVGFN